MSALAPKPQYVRTDWLGGVAAENRQREEEVERLRARVAELEDQLDVASVSSKVGWKLAKDLRLRIVELEKEREDAMPVPSAWPPTPMPIYDFGATSQDGDDE